MRLRVLWVMSNGITKTVWETESLKFGLMAKSAGTFMVLIHVVYILLSNGRPVYMVKMLVQVISCFIWMMLLSAQREWGHITSVQEIIIQKLVVTKLNESSPYLYMTGWALSFSRL